MAKLTLNNEDNDDIVTINAGGKMFQIFRSTLCLPPGDTGFGKLFGKATATKHTLKETMDEDGNFFFDHDPELIEIILNFLRAKKIEDPFDPIVEPPTCPPEKTKEFRRLLNHFGLTAFFYYPSILPTTATTIAIPIDTTPSLETEFLDKKIRSISIGSEVTASTVNTSKYHDSYSWTTPEDEAIAEGFDYCYG